MFRWLRVGFLGMIALIVVGSLAAVAAANTVPASNAADLILQSPITPNDLKPAQCSALNLTNLVTGGADGTNGNDLILGTAGADSINGGNGNDCILGGGGNDTLRGQGGTDVCDGGPGTDSFVGCETTLNDP
jgi:Ca2+-binding RTX toxin-like protein